MTEKLPTVPTGLSQETRAWWAQVVRDYELEGGHLKLLEMACRMLDRTKEARATLKKRGLTGKDKYGVARVHPCIVIERASALAFARLLRELNLDLDHEESRIPRNNAKPWQRPEWEKIR